MIIAKLIRKNEIEIARLNLYKVIVPVNKLSIKVDKTVDVNISRGPIESGKNLTIGDKIVIIGIAKREVIRIVHLFCLNIKNKLIRENKTGIIIYDAPFK
jgi:hypothetical protein